VNRAWLTCALVLNILDMGLKLAAAVMWTSMITSLWGQSGQVPMFNTNATVSIGPGFWILWAAVLGMLLVLPRALWEYVVWPFLQVLYWCGCEYFKNMNHGLSSMSNKAWQAETGLVQDFNR
jgi:hypothetical protein